MEKLIQAKGIIKPGANATQPELDAYYLALGRPATAAEYALTKPEKMTLDGKEVVVPKELWEAETASKASELFHKIGLTKEQAAALTNFDLERGLRAQGTVAGMIAAQKTKCETALKEAWGADYAVQHALAEKAAAAAGLTPEILAANPHLSNDPVYIKAMAKVGAMIIESPAAGARGGSHSSVNPAAEIAAIMNDPNHAWQPGNAKKNPAAHKAAVEHMAGLYRLKNGEAA